MTPTDLQAKYMRAVVRTATGHRAIDWTDEELAESFALVPEPNCGVAEWSKLLGIEVELGEDPLSQAHVAAVNSESLRHLPPWAKVDDGESS